MASEEPAVAVDSGPEPASTEAVEDKPDSKAGKTKGTKEPKAKKPAPARKPRSASTHPPYEEMIKDAIVILKEKTGSSQYAITKFIEEKHKRLPPNFKKLLLFHLKKLVASGKLVKVKGSFKIPNVRSSVPKSVASAPASPAKKKKMAAVSKVKPKAKEGKTTKAVAKAPVKAKAAAKLKAKPATKTKPAAKTKAVAAKTKATPAKAKAKPAAKAKAAAVKPNATAPKPKQKEKPAKASRTSTRTSPGKRTAAPKPAPKKALAPKKAPAKSVKPKSVKSPAKKATARRGKK